MLFKGRGQHPRTENVRSPPARAHRLRMKQTLASRGAAPTPRPARPVHVIRGDSRLLRSPIRASLLRAISESLAREPCLDGALEDVLERCLDATGSGFAAVYLVGSN